MICTSTSYNLRANVLRHAGPIVTKEFESHQDSRTVLITSGGSTSAKKILFLPWHDQPFSTDEQMIRQVNFVLIDHQLFHYSFHF